jgi:hypothetical protein
MSFRIVPIVAALLLGPVGLALADPLPRSIQLFERHREHLPVVQVAGRPYGGLNLCRLVARRHQPQPFFALPHRP